MSKKTPLVLKSRNVYVVLEHAIEDITDAYIHGVYTTRDAANKKKSKLECQNESLPRWKRLIPRGYVSVLKLPVKGANTLVCTQNFCNGNVIVFKNLEK